MRCLNLSCLHLWSLLLPPWFLPVTSCGPAHSRSFPGPCQGEQGNRKKPNFTDDLANFKGTHNTTQPASPWGPAWASEGRAVAFLIMASVSGPPCSSASPCLPFSAWYPRLGSERLKLD